MAFGGAVKLTGESEYKKALNNISQGLKEVSAQMKLTDASFDKNDKSVEALSERNKNLTSQLDLQRQKLSVLQTQYAKMSSEYEKNAKKHEALVKSYDEEKNKLDQIGKELGTESAEYKKQEQVVNQLAQEVKKSTTAQDANAKSMSKMRVELTNAQTECKKTEKAIDELGDELDDGGEKINKFAKLGSAIKGVGVALSAVGTAASAVGGAMASATKELATYADDMTTLSTVTGVSTDKLQAYNYAAELVDVSLDTMTGSMARNVKAMSSAASGSSKYADAYSKLGVSVTDANGQLRDGEDVYWESIDALGQISNETERDALAMQLFGKSAQELNPLIEKGSDGIKDLTDEAKAMGAVLSEDQLNAAAEFDDSMQRIKSGAGAAKNAIGTVLLPQLTELATGGKDLLGEFTNGILEANGDMEKIGDVIGKALSGAVDIINQMLPKVLNVGIGIVNSLLKGVLSALPELARTLVSAIPELVNALLSALPLLFTVGAQIIIELLAGLGETLPELITQVIAIVPLLVKTFADNIPLLLKGAVSFFMAIIQALPTIIKELLIELPKVIKTIVNFHIQSIPLILEAAVQLFGALISAIPQIIPQLIGAIPDIISAIFDALTSPDSIKAIGQAGMDLIKGLWNGIKDMTGWIGEKIKGFGESILSGLKKFFGIASPSKVMANVVGKNLALGIGQGFEDNIDEVNKDIQDGIEVNPIGNVAAQMASTVLDFNGINNRVNSAQQTATEREFGTMLKAFKTALSEMKIELDDEVAGEFVEKTVTRVVYS